MSQETLRTVLAEAARHVLLKLPLSGEDLEDMVEYVSQRAAVAPAIQRKFAYSLSDKGSVPDAKGAVQLIDNEGAAPSQILPSLSLKSTVRVKQRKTKLRIDLMLSNKSMDFFNEHYSNDFDFEYTQAYAHDHAEAAVSRKIETELCMMAIRERQGDLLRVPVNGYDYSVIDAGGDWRYHYVREQNGVHTDAPFLDARDHARDTRKRLQLVKCAETDAAVCRHSSEDCAVTAPYMTSIHSLMYTLHNATICETMAKRRVQYHIGTAQVPEALASLEGEYVDPHYGYIIEPVEESSFGLYLPPEARKGLNKFLYGGASNRKIRYRYPAGQSRSYEHYRDVVEEKLHAGIYDVLMAEGPSQRYMYSIRKRVGSIIFGEYKFFDDLLPAHSFALEKARPKFVDGYNVTFDENLLRDFAVKSGRSSSMVVPRQMFNAMASYCLLKVNDPLFTPEHAVSYAMSLAIPIEFNGVAVHEGGPDTYALHVVNALAGFVWAFDRYRLMKRRLGDLGVVQAQEQLKQSLASRIGGLIDVKQLIAGTKSALSQLAVDSVTDFAVRKTTSYGDLSVVYDKLRSVASPGITLIRDLAQTYEPINAQTSAKAASASYIGKHVVSADPPTHPIYDLPPTKTIARIRDETDAIRQGTFTDESVTVVADDSSTVTGGSTVDARPYILDMVSMAEAGEAERSQSAQELFDKAFDIPERRLISLEKVKGLVKGPPVCLEYRDGILRRIATLEKVYIRGDESFDEALKGYVDHRFIYPELTKGQVSFGTGVLRADQAFASDKRRRTSGQSFDAVLDSALRVLNSSQLTTLRKQLPDTVSINVAASDLVDGVAGSGKTTAQVAAYKGYADNPVGQTAAIFASTREAADEATSRLEKANVTVLPGSVSTIDSFLMNPTNWRQYALVLLDEALQMHAGKVYAVMWLTNAKVCGYGDTEQIQYIPFTRFHMPSVNTSFPWGKVDQVDHSYRIPKNKSGMHDIVTTWLQRSVLYGPRFTTHSTNVGGLYVYTKSPNTLVTINSIQAAYEYMGLGPTESLVILSFIQSETDNWANSLGRTRTMSDGPYPSCVKTVGMSQGGDFDNVLVVFTNSRDEPLHTKKDQTIVALTRHKRKLGILLWSTNFPSLIEQVGGAPPQIKQVVEARAHRRERAIFGVQE